ncbi:MAG: two-component system, sensor histidine kinase PdtaS [Fusobacteriaceae bacterium]|jgi:ribose transport system ATP-binding protein|nr:ATP-binding cassette protein [Fusobacteriales bacterium]MDN5303608.1 two-component system, sensor histidine kinase PdtaS [Fusobacteriaceae bacterium]
MDTTILKVQNLTVKNESKLIFKNLTFDVKKGEILGIIGDIDYNFDTFFKNIENNKLKYNGEIIYKDNKSISKKLKTGEIGVLFLNNNLIENLSIAENIFIKKYPKKTLFKNYILPFINWKEIYRNTEKILKKYNLDLKCNKKIKYLTNSEKKLINIIKILYNNPELVILHNPTEKLNAKMTENFFNILRERKYQEKSAIYITNKWEEMLKIADRILILSEGKLIKKYTSEDVRKNPQKLLIDLENNKYKLLDQDINKETKLILDSIIKSAEYINSNHEIKDLLIFLSKHLYETMKCDITRIYLIDEDSKIIIEETEYKNDNNLFAKLKKDTLIKIIKTEQFFYANKHENNFIEFFENLNGIKSMICFPIYARSNIIGLIQLNYKNYYIYSEEEILFLNAFSKQVAIAIEDTKLLGRSALLQESHHRIKNSLQSVINLIAMQKREALKNKEINIEESYNEIISRIKSIAIIHDLLAKEKLGRGIINLKDIINILLENIFQINKKIKIQLDIENIMIPYNRATSIALVINELITNAYKHAFINVDNAKIEIKCEKTDKEINLIITDNGKGIKEEEIEKSNSLGTKIIKSIIAHEFNGEIKYENIEEKMVKGTKIKIKIPIEKIFKE